MILILDNIRSVHNVGSIFRTADAAGVEKIYCVGITPEPVDRFGKVRNQFSKVSLGAEKSVAWEKVKNTSRLIDELKKKGFEIYGVEQSPRSISYAQRRKTKALKKCAFIFGNEISGLSSGILKKVDAILEIPMKGKKESLNVSVAVGIILFRLLY